MISITAQLIFAPGFLSFLGTNEQTSIFCGGKIIRGIRVIRGLKKSEI